MTIILELLLILVLTILIGIFYIPLAIWVITNGKFFDYYVQKLIKILNKILSVFKHEE